MEVSGVAASVENAVSTVSSSDPVSTQVQEKALETDKQVAETQAKTEPDPSSSKGQNVDITV